MRVFLRRLPSSKQTGKPRNVRRRYGARDAVRDILLIGGAIAVGVGIYQLYPAAALIYGGVLAVVVGLRGELAAARGGE
jgi:hypothetical protein